MAGGPVEILQWQASMQPSFVGKTYVVDSCNMFHHVVPINRIYIYIYIQYTVYYTYRYYTGHIHRYYTIHIYTYTYIYILYYI